MHSYSPWRFESEASMWRQHCLVFCKERGLAVEDVLKVAQWCLLWDRQICLELIRDAQADNQLSSLEARRNGSEPPNKTPFWEHSQLVQLGINRLRLYSHSSKIETLEPFAALLWKIVRSETDQCIKDFIRLGRADFLSRTAQLVDPVSLFLLPNGQRIESDTSSRYWGHWYPGLSNHDLDISQLIASLPGALDVEIPEVVRRLENPSSPVALPGAVSLPRHDVIHLLLGRGLLDQDEAFVVGFTMGNSSEFRDADGLVMRQALEHWYPEPFRIFGNKLDVFDLGVQAGKTTGLPDISLTPLEDLRNRTLGKARLDLRLCVETLRKFYVLERSIIPWSIESGRLPI